MTRTATDTARPSAVDRAARLYVSTQVWAAVVGILLVLGFATLLLVNAIAGAAHSGSVTPAPTVRSDCWDYGQPLPPGWFEGDPTLPSCHVNH